MEHFLSATGKIYLDFEILKLTKLFILKVVSGFQRFDKGTSEEESLDSIFLSRSVIIKEYVIALGALFLANINFQLLILKNNSCFK